MKIVTALKIAKPLTAFVAGAGVSSVVTEFVKHVKPGNLTRLQRFTFAAGGFFIGQAVVSAVADVIEKDFNSVIEFLEPDLETDNGVEVQKLLDSATNKLTVREYQALSHVLSQVDDQLDQKEAPEKEEG